MRCLNKLKQTYLHEIRFKCNNQKCTYQLTYDELILGTHELDDCNFMCVICEGCGLKIHKQDQIKHESIDCTNPLAKCQFCSKIFGLGDMTAHLKSCSQRRIVKVEYSSDPEQAAVQNTKLALMDFDDKPDQEYKPEMSWMSHASSQKSSRKTQKKAKTQKAKSAEEPKQVEVVE